MVSSLAAGGYTAQVSGAANGTGNGMVEVYDAALANASVRFINLSARTQVDAGQILIAGFSVGPGAAKSVLIRAVGPSLSAFEVTDPMTDPRIEVFNSAGARIMQNDNWDGSAALGAFGTSVGAFPLTAGSRDAALAHARPGRVHHSGERRRLLRRRGPRRGLRVALTPLVRGSRPPPGYIWKEALSWKTALTIA